MIRRFCSGSSTPCEPFEKQIGRVDHAERDSEPPGEDRLHPFALAGAQEPGVDEDAFKPVADRAMNQRGGDRGIDAARQSHQHAPVAADARANLRELGLDERSRRPIAGLAANLMHEVAEHLHAARRVRDLGMELDAPQQAIASANRGIRRIAAVRDRFERGRYRLDAIAVTHPHGEFPIGEPFEQFIALVDHQLGRTVLALAGARAMRAQMLRDHVQPVADSEHRASDA